MSRAADGAAVIVAALAEAQSNLVGKAVVLTDGKAGTVESVNLDEDHGLRIAITGHNGKWPVSTSRLKRSLEGKVLQVNENSVKN